MTRMDAEATQPSPATLRKRAEVLHSAAEITQPTPSVRRDQQRQTPVFVEPAPKQEEQAPVTDHLAFSYEIMDLPRILTPKEAKRLSQETQAYHTLLFNIAEDKKEISAADQVDTALKLAEEEHILPLPIKKLVKLIFLLERKKVKRKEPVLDQIKRHTSRSWWFWHMIAEGQSKDKALQEKALTGRSGCWYADAQLRHPIPCSSNEQMIHALSQTVFGLVQTYEQSMQYLQDAHTDLNFRYTAEHAKDKKPYPKLPVFASRLRSSELPLKDWLEHVARSGKKEIGIYFSQQEKDVKARTPEELSTIHIRIYDNGNQRELYFRIPEGKSDARSIWLAINHMLQQPNQVVGVPVEHPIYEIELTTDQLYKTNHLDRLATASPVSKVVLHKSRHQTIDGVRFSFPHLTANESQGWELMQHVVGELHAEPFASDRLLNTPEIIYAKPSKKKARDNRGKRVRVPYEELQIVAGCRMTSEENDFILRAQTILKELPTSINMTTAEMFTLVQNTLSTKGTYICVGAKKGELQMSLAPTTEDQELRTLLLHWFELVDKMSLSHAISQEMMTQWTSSNPNHEQELLRIFTSTQQALEEITGFINRDIAHCQTAKGMIPTLETYVSPQSRALLRALVPQAAQVFEGADAQVSLVSHKSTSEFRFVSANSSTADTAVGGFTCLTQQGISRTMTVRSRLDIQDIQHLMSTLDLSTDVDRRVYTQATRDVQEKVFTLRKQLMKLCLLIVELYEKPDKKDAAHRAYNQANQNIHMDELAYLPQ